MLECHSNDISEGIDNIKTNASKECDICHNWYFLGKYFSYEPYPCNDCHDLIREAINFNDVVIVSVKESDCRIHFWYMTKYNAIKIMNNSDLSEKGRLL